MASVNSNPQLSGVGAITPISLGVGQLGYALKKGQTNFSLFRQMVCDREYIYPVATLENVDIRKGLSDLPLNSDLIERAKRIRNISLSTLYSIYSTLEAWADAGLPNEKLNYSRIAIVSAGSNLQQDHLHQNHEKYRDRLKFINPNYAINFLDTDIIGVISELFGIKGEGYTVGGASASGSTALIHAHRLISLGDYDVVLVVAPLMQLSIYEYQAFTALGAMAHATEDTNVDELCRPFDVDHKGFVSGQNAGCIILESAKHVKKRDKDTYCSVEGYGLNLDANRNPNPSLEGETLAMKTSLAKANIKASDIDYVNTHGTASVVGDKTECQAIIDTGMKGVKANSTKSLIGHGISAAGVVEAIAGVVQMKQGFIHKSHNLNTPITDEIEWSGSEFQEADIRYMMSNGFGFGGINTSIIFKRTDK